MPKKRKNRKSQLLYTPEKDCGPMPSEGVIHLGDVVVGEVFMQFYPGKFLDETPYPTSGEVVMEVEIDLKAVRKLSIIILLDHHFPLKELKIK